MFDRFSDSKRDSMPLRNTESLFGNESLHRRWASYHEAGHAVVAWQSGLPPGGLGLTIGPRGKGIYYHGWALWRLLVPRPDQVRGKVFAGAEMFQAGLLAEYLAGSDCPLYDLSSAQCELDPLLDCHIPGRWGTTCRNVRLSLGCGVDELDDAPRALLLLLVYSSLDVTRLGGEPLRPGAIDHAYRLTPAEPKEIVSAFLASQRRVLRTLKQPRTWRTIEELAGELFIRGQVSPQRAVEIMDGAQMSRSSLPFDALPRC
jgi:hypothetical protein